MGKVLRQYKSTIYGNYRKAYLKCGILTGLASALLMLFLWMIRVDDSRFEPCGWEIELMFAVVIGFECYRYRKSLPGEKVTLKELMLFGLGSGVVGAVIYGVLLVLLCATALPGLKEAFVEGRIAVMPSIDEGFEAKQAIETVRGYTAADWGFIGGFRAAVMSVLIAFLAAIVLRTEKSEVVS
ncbi:MAG: DUF4199 domain-containing protein [Bacteroidales bacterium]|nr:DUF4199 domain-containing protein [Bacteroidales bacterium]